jgi:hypothetical protein
MTNTTNSNLVTLLEQTRELLRQVEDATTRPSTLAHLREWSLYLRLRLDRVLETLR